ncbi:hypothetical protein C8F04DRAFT_1098242 [Mycena alexandri]|uniref:Uncharacterized protein n=1 Tax=Mycena alexandri TaxID=1745969 RepID=A0AAD6X3J8_9AGAR|nr:hypothetical protein C8F04DRAFT_1098242 [Mycena alexandri]
MIPTRRRPRVRRLVASLGRKVGTRRKVGTGVWIAQDSHCCDCSRAGYAFTQPTRQHRLLRYLDRPTALSASTRRKRHSFMCCSDTLAGTRAWGLGTLARSRRAPTRGLRDPHPGFCLVCACACAGPWQPVCTYAQLGCRCRRDGRIRRTQNAERGTQDTYMHA